MSEETFISGKDGGGSNEKGDDLLGSSVPEKMNRLLTLTIKGGGAVTIHFTEDYLSKIESSVTSFLWTSVVVTLLSVTTFRMGQILGSYPPESRYQIE